MSVKELGELTSMLENKIDAIPATIVLATTILPGWMRNEVKVIGAEPGRVWLEGRSADGRKRRFPLNFMSINNMDRFKGIERVVRIMTGGFDQLEASPNMRAEADSFPPPRG